MAYFEDNYVFLSSDIKPDIGMQALNRQSHFHTHLPARLYLSEDYEVAIADITYNKTWFNITKPERISLRVIDYDILSEDKNMYGISLTLPIGHYETASHLLYATNEILSKLWKKNPTVFSPPFFSIDENQTNKIKLSLGVTNDRFDSKPNNKQYIIPNLSVRLCGILGFITKQGDKLHKSNVKKFINSELQSIDFDSTPLLAIYPARLEFINSLHIYTDIIEPRIVGNIKAPLLRQVEIPNGIKFGDSCHIKFKKKYYHPLSHYEIDNILISIKDEDGNEIEFNGGRVSLALHFRRRKDKFFKSLENIFK